MSFLQLVLSLDKTIKEIILLWRICQFDTEHRTQTLLISGLTFNPDNPHQSEIMGSKFPHPLVINQLEKCNNGWGTIVILCNLNKGVK